MMAVGSRGAAALLLLTAAVLSIAAPPAQADGAAPAAAALKTSDPPPSSSWSGGFAGIDVAGSFSHVKTTVKSAATGAPVAGFSNNGSNAGGGLNLGYQWQFPNNFLLGGVIDGYFPNDRVRHPLLGGAFLSSSVDFTAAFQARAGYVPLPNLLLYGQAGVALGSQALKVRFGGLTSSHTDTTAGYTVGAGVEYRIVGEPASVLGQPPQLFFEYAHIFWNDAHFNRPAAAPAFNVTWARDSDVLKGGIRVQF